MDSYYELLANEEPVDNTELSSSINYHNITHDDMLNGDGLRVVLWVAGCSHGCKECQNPITWDPNGGIPFTQWEEAEFWEWLAKPWTQGATFSGGDPLHYRNRDKIASMCKTIKEKYPNKDIYIYTGYRMTVADDEEKTVFFESEDRSDDKFVFPALQYVDVVIDGKFHCESRKKDLEEKNKVLWRGSSNQRIIDVQATLKEKSIIERMK